MVPKEILKKVRQIEIRTRHLLNDVFSGEYQSVFRGRGMVFDEVRAYLPGDDIRTIDWNVTARTGYPYVKRYVEERELTVMLLVDASGSGAFGSVHQMKGETGVEISALLAFSAIKNNDKVGLIVFTDQVELFIPPKKGRKHVLRVVRELLFFHPQGRRTRIASALEFLNRVSRRRTIAFLISDFIDQDYQKALRVASRRHDLVPITLTDPREMTLPPVGLLELEDAERGTEVLVDTWDAAVRARFAEASRKRRAQRERLFRSLDLEAIQVRMDQPYIEPLLHFFQMRAKKFR